MVENSTSGSIILLQVMYNNEKTTFASLEKIINELKIKDYAFMRAGDIIRDGDNKN